MSLPLFDRQTVEQPLQLPARDYERLPSVLRPAEPPAFQPTVMKPKAVIVPAKDFELVALAIAKYEPAIRKRIHLEYRTDQHRQSIDRFPQIRGPGSQVDLSH